jgi:hypothetical protein
MQGMPWRSAKRREKRRTEVKGTWHHDAKTNKEIGGGSE